MKNTLKNLCLSNGWSYGVFWGFDFRNNLLLTMEDSYYEEHASNVVDNMLLQVHALGEGKIGEAAFDGKHRWMFLDNMKDDYESSLPFSPKIKTVAVIPVEKKGVLEFGSTREIVETPEFLERTRKFLGETVCFVGSGCSSSEKCDLTEQIGLLGSSNDSMSWENLVDGIEDRWTFDSLPVLDGELFGGIEEFLVDPNFGSSLVNDGIFEDISSNVMDTFEEHLAPSDFPSPLFDSSLMEDLAQLLDDSSNGMFSSSLGDKIGGSCDKEKSWSNGGLLDELEIDIEFGKVEDYVESNSLPTDSHRIMPDCKTATSVSPRKGLFSELGLEHLLKDISSSSSIEDPWNASNIRKPETFEAMYNQKYPNWNLNSGFLKAESHYSYTDTKSCISNMISKTKTTEEPIKATKKKTRLGESRKPRPKDRQMIADRIKELRDLVPNGSKLSIDALLGRTIKHILFGQNVKKHAEILKLVNEPKLIGLEKGSVNKGSSTSVSTSRHATWAYEVGGSNLSCPIIVEDLRHPGQMLIEMLCEDQGYFLEIIDVVRSFGLTILKGVMESRDSKIWAHFIVEGNNHITRIDVFMSLMQLLQGASSVEEISKSDVLPEWRNYQHYNNQQQMVSILPII